MPLACTETVAVALSHFPELQDVHIQVRFKHAFSPLSTRPSWGNIFRAKKNRLYIITISNKSITALNPILFEHLDEAAKRGVIGHELSHVSDFHKMTWWQLLHTGIGHLSPAFLDRFEYRTDSICIAHGLGNELLAWSVFVRQALHITNWRGANNIQQQDNGKERYMNPVTIERILNIQAK